MEAYLNKVQNNFNTYQGEITRMLDKILAAIVTIRSTGDIAGIGSAGTSAKSTLN